jgi:hypothetical protein
MTLTKNLNIFIFQQSWFHLASLIESVIDKKAQYSQINLKYISKGLKVLPIDVHQIFLRKNNLFLSPENVASSFLSNYFSSNSNFFNDESIRLNKIRFKSNLTFYSNSIHDLQRVKWQETNIGIAISSFLITMTKNSQPNLNKYRKLMTNLEKTYIQIFNYLETLNLRPDSDEIWVYNGRPFHERVIVEFATKKKIKIKYFEIGGEGFNQSRWILHDYSPHNRLLHQQSIIEHFNQTSTNLDAINNWYQNQKTGKENPHSKKFNTSIKTLKFPKYFVYFSSSDDEVAAISLDWDSAWGSQLNAVREIIDFFLTRPDLNLVIRVHPNQANKSKSDRAQWRKLNSDANNIQIYSYKSRINSYHLLENSVGVLTYGGTLGIEASYYLKNAALLAPARWDQLAPQKIIQSKVELDDWVNQSLSQGYPNQKFLNLCYQGSLMWGHYMTTAGYPWSVILVKKDFRGINVGYVAGRSLRPNLFLLVVSKYLRRFRLHIFQT